MANLEKAAALLKEVFKELDIDETIHTKDTPLRIAKMWDRDFFSSRNKKVTDKVKLTSFEKDGVTEVEVTDIFLQSYCAHHFMPFYGMCNIKVRMDGKILGLSKFTRIAQFCANKPQVQEELTKEIAQTIIALDGIVYCEVETVMEHDCVKRRFIDLSNQKTKVKEVKTK